MKKVGLFLVSLLFIGVFFSFFTSAAPEKELSDYFSSIESKASEYNSGSISLIQLLAYLDGFQGQINEYFRENTKNATSGSEDAVVNGLLDRIEAISIKNYGGGETHFSRSKYYKSSDNAPGDYRYGYSNLILNLKDVKLDFRIYYNSGFKYSAYFGKGSSSENGQEIYSPPSFGLDYSIKPMAEGVDLSGKTLKEQMEFLKAKVENSLSDNFVTKAEQSELKNTAAFIQENFNNENLNSYENCLNLASTLGLESSKKGSDSFYIDSEGKNHTSKTDSFTYSLGKTKAPWGEEINLELNLGCYLNKLQDGSIESSGGYVGFNGMSFVQKDLQSIYYSMFQQSQQGGNQIEQLGSIDELKDKINSLVSQLTELYGKTSADKSEILSILETYNVAATNTYNLVKSYDDCNNLADDLGMSSETTGENGFDKTYFTEGKDHVLQIPLGNSLWNGFNKTIQLECRKAKSGSDFTDTISIYSSLYSKDYFYPYDLTAYVLPENETEYSDYIQGWQNKTKDELIGEFGNLADDINNSLNQNTISIATFRELNKRFSGLNQGISFRLSQSNNGTYELCNEFMKSLGMTEFKQDYFDSSLSDRKYWYYIIQRAENPRSFEQRWYISGYCGKYKDSQFGIIASISPGDYISVLDDNSNKPITTPESKPEEITMNIKAELDSLFSNITRAYNQGTISDQETIKSLSNQASSITNAFYNIKDFSQCKSTFEQIGLKRQVFESEAEAKITLTGKAAAGIPTQETYYLIKKIDDKNALVITGTCNDNGNNKDQPVGWLQLNLFWSLGDPILSELGENPNNFYNHDVNMFYNFGRSCDVVSLKDNINLLNKLKSGINQDLLKWYFDKFTSEGVSGKLSDLALFEGLRFMNRVSYIEQNVAQSIMSCSKDDLAQISQQSIDSLSSGNINIKYKNGDDSAEIWSETIKLGTEPDSVRMSFLLSKVSWFPNSETFKSILVGDIIKSLEDEVQRNAEFRKKYPEYKNQQENEVIKFISDKYGGSFDVKIILFDNGEEFLTKYFQINPEVNLGVASQIAGEPDVTLEVNYGPLYNLISSLFRSFSANFETDLARGGFYYEIVDQKGLDSKIGVPPQYPKEGEDQSAWEEYWKRYNDERQDYIKVISTSNNDYRTKQQSQFQQNQYAYVRFAIKSVVEFMLNRNSVEIKPSFALVKFYWNLGEFIDFLKERQQLSGQEQQLANDIRNQIKQGIADDLTGANK